MEVRARKLRLAYARFGDVREVAAGLLRVRWHRIPHHANRTLECATDQSPKAEMELHIRRTIPWALSPDSRIYISRHFNVISP